MATLHFLFREADFMRCDALISLGETQAGEIVRRRVAA
jgi:hypothetical protein